LREGKTGWEDEEVNVNSYWKIKEKREGIGVWKRKH